MRTVFTTTMILLALTGTALTSGCMSHRDGRYGRADRDRGYRAGGVATPDFGNIAYGYRDGYWDNGRNWHQWGNDKNREGYRRYHGNRYSDWNHDRDGDDGSRRN